RVPADRNDSSYEASRNGAYSLHGRIHRDRLPLRPFRKCIAPTRTRRTKYQSNLKRLPRTPLVDCEGNMSAKPTNQDFRIILASPRSTLYRPGISFEGFFLNSSCSTSTAFCSWASRPAAKSAGVLSMYTSVGTP